MKQTSYAKMESTPGNPKTFAPAKHKATPARRNELKLHMLHISDALADGTLYDLCVRVGIQPSRPSEWFHWGELPPYLAAELSKRYETRRRQLRKKGKKVPPEITLKDLTPSLFLPG